MLKEGATIIVAWKKYQKRKVHTLKGKLALIDYKRLQKVGHGPQSLLIDFKRSQRSHLDYKVY